MENNSPLSEEIAKRQESAAGYWSTPEQVKAAAEAVVEAPVEAVETPAAEAVVVVASK